MSIFSRDRDTPFSYNIIRLNTPRASDILRDAVDPNNLLRRLKISFRDWSLRDSYLNHIFKDMSSVDNMIDLHPSILRLSRDFKRTQIYQHAGITMNPSKEKESLEVNVIPVKASRPFFFFSQFNLGSTYGLGGTLRAKNVAGLLDTLSFNIVAGVYGPIRGSYSFVYEVPFLQQEFGLNVTVAKNYSRLSPSINEINSFESISLTRRNLLFRLSHAWRENQTGQLSFAKDNQELQPSEKYALSTQSFWDYASDDKSTGNRVVLEGEWGAVQNADRFLKFRVKNDSFYGFNRNKEDNLKRGPYEFIVENLFDFGLSYPLGNGRLRINDRNFQDRMRGFGQILDKPSNDSGYRGDDVYVKNSVLLYLNKQFPIFNVLFTPFVHFSYGYFSGNVFNKEADGKLYRSTETLDPEKNAANRLEDSKARYSAGIGLSSRLHPLVTCEALVNLLSVGAASDKATVLQFHIGL